MGYAVFESLALTSSGEGWATLMTARIGTSVLHILTAGMTGWALAQAWRSGRYSLLAATYLGAVAIHSILNGLTLLFMVANLPHGLGLQIGIPGLSGLDSIAPAALVGLAALIFLGLFWANRRLARQEAESHSLALPPH